MFFSLLSSFSCKLRVVIVSLFRRIISSEKKNQMLHCTVTAMLLRERKKLPALIKGYSNCSCTCFRRDYRAHLASISQSNNAILTRRYLILCVCVCVYVCASSDGQTTLTNDIANRSMALNANSELFTCAHVCAYKWNICINLASGFASAHKHLYNICSLI